ncbi:MAG TPA: hypothetical protein PK069_02645 [Methanolinea sp.]|nr:hypothetical protein [Methanolinea sp.]
MEKITILLSQGDLYNTLTFFEELIPVFSNDFDIYFIGPSTPTIQKKLRNEKIKYFGIFNKNNKKISSEISYEELSRIENFLGYPIEKIIFSDPEFYSFYVKNKNKALNEFIRIFNNINEILTKNPIYLFFTFGEDRLYNIIPYLILKRKGGKSYLVSIIPYYGITLTTDFFGSFTEQKIKFSNLEKADFEHYSRLVKQSKVYFDSDAINQIDFRKYINPLNLIRKICKIAKFNKENQRTFYSSHTNINVLKVSQQFFLKKYKTNKIKNFYKSIQKPLSENRKYIYYPLHFTEDAQILLKFPEGYNQYELIRNIAKNLPINYGLIIKEHPGYIGQYDYNQMFNLSQIPNVFLFDPFVSSKEVFNNCDIILTINSTVGFEALFFNKNVITLGKPFYNHFPGVIHIETLNDLFSILTNVEIQNCCKNDISNYLCKSTLDLLNSSIVFNYQDFYKNGNVEMLSKFIKNHINNTSSFFNY